MSSKTALSRVTLRGPLTVQYAADIQAAISAKFQETDCAGIETQIPAKCAADLSAVQLLLAARRHAAERGIQFALSKSVSGPLRDMVEKGGFLTDAADKDRSFWLHE